MKDPRRYFAPVAFLLLGLTACTAPPRDGAPTTSVLLSSGETVIGQRISYPQGTATITAAIVTLPPGAETGWHRHDVPLFAYVLEGELTVDYGSDGQKTYSAGEAFLEAFKTEHNGINPGPRPAKILAVYAGAEGVPNTVPRKP